MKRRTVSLNVIVILAVSIGAQVATAHLPMLDDGSAADAEHALVILDIGLSQVVYHEVRDPVRPLWIAFDAVAAR
jgi:hypothetical protein